jgi:protein SCO1/2
MNHQRIRFAALCACLAGGLAVFTGCPKSTAGPNQTTTTTTPPTSEVKYEGPPLTEFTLTDSVGSQFKSAELTGKVWVASFFFTRCAANCRALNMQIAQLQRDYGPRGLQVVSISCDPKYDTPKVLAEYAEMYNAQPDRWHFLTGDIGYIKRVSDDMFDLPLKEKYHEDQLVVVDGQGKVRGSFHVRQPEQFDRVKKLLDQLLPADQADESASSGPQPAGENRGGAPAPE